MLESGIGMTRVLQKYVEEYEKLVKWHNLHEQVRILEEKAKYPLSPSLAKEYEELDSIRCNITYMAEKKCRKLCKGQVSFSPELQLTSRHIATWSLLRSKAMGGKFSSRLISRTLKKASVPSSAHSFSLVEMEVALRRPLSHFMQLRRITILVSPLT
jgi:hypothetical protein